MSVMWRKSFIIICLLFLFAEPQYNQNTMGPYEVILKHIEQCDHIGTGEILLWIQGKRLSRSKKVYDGNLTLRTPFDDNLMVSVNGGQFTHNGINYNFFRRDFPKACYTFSLFIPNIMKDLSKELGIENHCPIPKGAYVVQNFTTKQAITQIPMFFYSKYKTEVAFKRNGKIVGCNYFYTEIVPKRAHRRSK